jgi:hypothetical protein
MVIKGFEHLADEFIAFNPKMWSKYFFGFKPRKARALFWFHAKARRLKGVTVINQ